MAEVKTYKEKVLPSNPKPNAVYWIKASNASDVVGYITDINGVPYPLKDLQGSGGITTLTNTDGNLVITGADNKVINLAPALLSVINSALQPEQQIIGETPLGDVNGINAIFTTINNLIPNSEEVYVNGSRQKKPDDYNISGQNITFTFSPQLTETILIDYIKI